MTRVLFVEAAGNLWGSERSLLDMLTALPALNVAVSCPPRRPLVVELESRGIRTFPTFVYRLHEKARWQRMDAAIRLLQTCLLFRPDVIHLNQSGSYKVALLSAQILDIPIVAHIRIFEDAAYLARQWPVTRRLRGLVAISRAVEKEIRRFEALDAIPLHTIYNAYVSQHPSAAAPVPGARVQIACVGRLVPIKGQDVLIEAMAWLKQSGSPVQCVMAGEGDAAFTTRLKILAADRDVASAIEWAGFVADVARLLQRCEVLVCPSQREPLGRVIYEAWDAGLVPIVFAGSGGAAEIVSAADGGIVYDAQTPESLGRAVRAALELDAAERARLVANGRHWIAANCSPTAYGEAFSLIMVQASRPQARVSRRDEHLTTSSGATGRIIFVPFIEAFGGVERLILGLSRFLHERGLAHTVVCFADTTRLRSYATWPMPVHQLRPMRNPLVEGWMLHRYLTAAHARGGPAPLLFDLKGAFYAGLFRMPPYHLHLTDPPSLLQVEASNRAYSLRHGSRPEPPARMAEAVRGEIVHRINKRGAVRARSVVAMSDFIAAELRAIYSVVPTVVRPGVQAPPRSVTGPRSTHGFRALSVCRLEPNKRVDWILRACALLPTAASSDAASDWSLDIVGDGSQRERLQGLAGDLGIAAKVTFHGPVSDEHLDELFRSAQLFLMPAAQGYGLPALEALARGVPVVLHRQSGVSEILRDTPWVEIIDGGVADLARVIQTMAHRINSGDMPTAVPPFPTETDWAREIARMCEWI